MSDFQVLFDKAKAAGLAAGNACVPVPMRVVERENPFNDASPVKKDFGVYADGACGFAWLNVKPGNSAFAKWLVANGIARKDSYAGGVSFSISEYRQSLAKREAHAHAMAKVLREAGIKAYSNSRID